MIYLTRNLEDIRHLDLTRGQIVPPPKGLQATKKYNDTFQFSTVELEIVFYLYNSSKNSSTDYGATHILGYCEIVLLSSVLAK